jgi:type I restriction enzyme, S subunit
VTVARVSLKDICEISWGDTTVTKASYVTEGYPAFSASGCDGFLPYFDHEGPGVVLSAIGAQCGKSWFTQGRWSCIKNTIFIKSRSPNADTRYVYYAISDPDVWPKRGAAQPFISQTDARNVEIELPPLPVQHRIAGLLSAYDELIENSQRRIRCLETMARALYREWFIHFRFPGHEKHPRGASPLGEIPQGWEVKKLGDVSDTYRGRSYRSVDLAEEGGLPFLNLKCIDRDGGFRRQGLKRYTGEYKESHVAKAGDIVMAVTDMTQERRIVARAASVPTLDSDFGIFSMDLVRIEPRPFLPKVFLYSFLRYSSFAEEVKQYANGANVLHLSAERITDFRFAVPDAGLMQHFADFVGPALRQIDALQNTIDNLRHTRDLLLPRLISGQLGVEAA